MNRHYPRFGYYGFSSWIDFMPQNPHHRNRNASNRQGFANLRGVKKGRK